MMNSLARIPSWIASHWRTSAVIACAAIGIAATTRWCLESDEVRIQREERNREKELRALADRISTYAKKSVNGTQPRDVVVSVQDLSEKPRKRPEIVATALNLLLGEQRVQKAPLNGYWKLNV